MVDNQRKAVLFGNNFQSFLISSQSTLGQSHNISAILAECVVSNFHSLCVKCDFQSETYIFQS